MSGFNPLKIVKIEESKIGESVIRLEHGQSVQMEGSADEVVARIAEMTIPRALATISDPDGARIAADLASWESLGTPTRRNRGLGALFPDPFPENTENV